MSKTALMLVAALLCLLPQAFAQSVAPTQKAFSTWNVHTPDTVVEGRSPYPVGVMTPVRSIVVRRLEALSNKGPTVGSLPSGEPIPCPVQYVLELTNGATTQLIPISNSFLSKRTSQTYTDSGPLSLSFSAGNRITVSMIAPKPQFPPVSCFIMGLDITIQYELAYDPAPKTPTGDNQ
jgi:hypothetical protein